ncbi:type III secretion system translocon subunit SctE [Endozoicomonas elysicola]|uniref:Translocator protein BipB-like C-terminal domain-containing protein n=1 Tax=Endozoicomonas elysicola TaxID=305900 RepID=A0A081K9I2_9GAMM|nr:type III secretion system translocon subunit SctE [Endozoicomonas elysicola]KEI70808.1 hypothetical protein GV64_08650 [Endozoicomonas elysicola]
MSTIQQGPQSTDQTGIDPSLLQQQKKEQVAKEERVSRGYPPENSVSTASAQDDIDPPIKAQHNLDVPTEGSDSPSEKVLKEISVFAEIEKLAKSDPEAAKLGLLSEFLVENGGPDILDPFGASLERQNPLAKHISTLQSNKDHLLSLGYSEELIDGLLAMADPNDPDNSLASMHSFSARVTGRLAGDDSLENLSNLFADTLNRVGNLKGGPADLHAQLQADLKNFNATFLNSKKHIDVDTATQMLMSIQTKIQNNRLLFDQENIKLNQVAREQASEKRINKILDSIEKAKEAKKAGMISRIFGYIAVAIMAVVMVVMFATGVGSPLAMGLMAAALALTVLMTVSSETGDWMNKGVAQMFEAFGLSEENAMIGAMVFWSAIILVLSAGGAVAAGAGTTASTAANAAATGTSAAAGGASGGATVTAQVTTAATTTARLSRMASMAARFARLARIAGGGAMVGDGSSSAVSTTMQYQADMLRAEAKELFAWMLANQHIIDDLTEDIRKVIEDMQQVWQVMTGMMKDTNETMTKLNAALKG